MKFTAIFIIIFIFSPLICCGNIALGGRMMMSGRGSSDQNTRELRRLIRKVEQLARISGKRSSEVRLFIRPGAPAFRISETRRYRICDIPGHLPQWQKSPELRRQLYSAILYARFDLPHLNHMPLIPWWLVAALDEANAHHNGSEKYLSSNRDYTLMREMLRTTGALPDFPALTRMPLPADAVFLHCFRQHSRLLLEIFARRKNLSAILENSITFKAPDHWVKNFASPAEAQYVLTRDAAKIVWTRHFPLPQQELLKRTAELESTLIPELDASGVPTGKMRQHSFAEAAALLAKNPNRPDAGDIRNSFAASAMKFFMDSTPEVRVICEKLRRISQELGINDDAPARYAGELKRLRATLLKEIEREEKLRQLARKTLPVRTRYELRFKAAQPAEWGVTEAVRAKLDAAAAR